MTNFGWNYPAGVTGNEWQIAGVPEREETVECRSTATVHFRHQVQVAILLAALTSKPIDIDTIDTQEIDCEWSGTVEGWCDFMDFVWTCPRCGNEQVEDGYFEPDPDEDRDW